IAHIEDEIDVATALVRAVPWPREPTAAHREIGHREPRRAAEPAPQTDDEVHELVGPVAVAALAPLLRDEEALALVAPHAVDDLAPVRAPDGDARPVADDSELRTAGEEREDGQAAHVPKYAQGLGEAK